MTTATKKPEATPEWATRTTWRFVQQIHKLSQVSRLAKSGLVHLSQMHDIVQALVDLKHYVEPGAAEKALTEAREDAKLSREELDAGFPLLHSQAAISLWSYLEGMIRNLVSEWIRNMPKVRETAAIANLRVRLADYEQLDSEEKHYYIFDQLEQSLGSALKHGTNRFETLLDVCGLSGPVPEHISRDLFELQQLRHVLVHRGGIADRKYLAACPWVQASIGEFVNIDGDMLDRYFYSVNGYVIILLARIGKYFGDNFDDALNGGPYARPWHERVRVTTPNNSLERTR